MSVFVSPDPDSPVTKKILEICDFGFAQLTDEKRDQIFEACQSIYDLGFQAGQEFMYKVRKEQADGVSAEDYLKMVRDGNSGTHSITTNSNGEHFTVVL